MNINVFTRIKPMFCLLAVLVMMIATNLPGHKVYAATEDESLEDIETVTPSVVVRTYADLLQAIDESEDRAVIGISDVIEIETDIGVLGSGDKKIKIVRMGDNGYFSISSSGKVKVENIIFDGNSSAYNEGYVPMFQVYGKVDFENVTFQNCENGFSGGAIVACGGDMNISKCIFKGNQASEGGHIMVQNAKIKVTDCIFKGGIASSGGGAISVAKTYGYENGISFDRCVITGNQAIYGGGLAMMEV